MPLASVSKKRSSSAFSTSMMRFSSALRLRIGLAHQLHQVGHQLVEERRLLAQLVAVADGAADDAALHVAAAFVATGSRRRLTRKAVARMWSAITRSDGCSPGPCSPVSRAGGLDQRVEDVDLVVAVHVLQDRGQALQAHAGVHAGRGQRLHAAVRLHVELHEHVVPDLDVAVAVLVGRCRAGRRRCRGRGRRRSPSRGRRGRCRPSSRSCRTGVLARPCCRRCAPRARAAGRSPSSRCRRPRRRRCRRWPRACSAGSL